MLNVGQAFLIAAGISSTLWIISTLQQACKQGLRAVPGPLAARFTRWWRVKFVWSGDAHEKYRKLHEQYGPIVRTAPDVIDLSDPRAIPTIYGINSKFLKSKFYTTLAVMYDGKHMDSMFSTQDPEFHRALKRPVSQKFSMTSIRTLEPLLDPCSQIFTDSMRDLAGQPVDLGEWLQWYAFDAIGMITFHRTFGFMERRQDVNRMIEGLEFGLRYGGIIGQVPSLHPWLLGSPKLLSLHQKLLPNVPVPTTIAANMVLESLNSYDEQEAGASDQRTDLLAYLRQQEQKKDGARIGDRDMMNHLMNNLLAGSDTTAISLRAVFYYLLQDQRTYQKLQAEIDEADKAGRLSTYVSYGESLELKYLQICLKEAMRMHPGVAYPLERVVPEGGAELCDVYIPAGTIVGVNAAVIHRDKSIFGEDANVFRPERWEANEAQVKIMDRHLLTFGGGARTCIGKNISIMEMGKIVPQLLRKFDLQWASPLPTWTVKTWWFAKQSGMIVMLRPRLHT